MDINYKQKYLKYKKKYIDLTQYLKKNNKTQVGGQIQYTTVEEGTILFRVAPNIRELRTFEGRLRNSRLCEDTDKTGLYFGNKAIISLAICIEYNRVENMELGVFRVIEPITNISNDKYSFREIHPERYFNENGEFIRNTNVLPEENISHINCELNLLNSNRDYLLPEHLQESINCLKSCEIFLSNQNDDLNKIEMIAAFRFNPSIIRTANDLLEYMERNHYPFDSGKYIDDGIIIPL
jgi:hypothetical protein